MIDEPAWRSPPANTTRLITCDDAPNFRSNQNTTNVVTTNPPANASSAKSELSLKTVFRDRSSGCCACEAPAASTAGESLRAINRQASAPTGNNKSHRCAVGAPVMTARTKAGPPAARAPNAPARNATALYRPKTWSRVAGGACPIIACSNEVIGPDSLASVDIVPVRAATIKIANDEVSANTVPEMPSRTSSTA